MLPLTKEWRKILLSTDLKREHRTTTRDHVEFVALLTISVRFRYHVGCPDLKVQLAGGVTNSAKARVDPFSRKLNGFFRFMSRSYDYLQRDQQILLKRRHASLPRRPVIAGTVGGMKVYMTQPLLGIQPSLDSLFETFQFQPDAPSGHVLLIGLPGTVRDGLFLFTKPREEVRRAVAARCVNGSIGGFRAIRSAYWMKQELLPVYAYDLPHIASFLVALVPYTEHGRFECAVDCNRSQPCMTSSRPTAGRFANTDE